MYISAAVKNMYQGEKKHCNRWIGIKGEYA
jgi:hypothetical protein